MQQFMPFWPIIVHSGEGSISSCDPDLVYNKQTGNCEKKSRVEKCLKDKRWDKSASSNENIGICK